jgi:hypothetical protein
MKRFPLPHFLCAIVLAATPAQAADAELAAQAKDALRKAGAFYRTKVAVGGGYVYFYSPDLSQRFGEGRATPTQVWVQPPGTPTVGLAYLKAHEATGDAFYLEAARAAAHALIYGQLESGGWIHHIDFDPKGRVHKYRNGRGGGRNFSALDDGVTQSALRFLMHADRALGFKDAQVHQSVQIARAALLRAQFANGAFPQGWEGPVPAVKPMKAQYPDYDWRTENRIKEYWHMFTLNDDLAGDVSDTLLAAWEIYQDEASRQALVKLGDFLILAQMPEPQPAWAQQYDYQMRPIWARKFEPPGISPRESQDAIETLLKVYRLTGDEKYLEPIPRALAYLRKSLLPDGRHARYYELRNNKPLYMTRDYQLTNSDANLPTHYGFKTESRLDEVEAAFQAVKGGKPPKPARTAAELEKEVRRIIRELDAQGRWLSKYAGEGLIGQTKFPMGALYLSSEQFSRNLETLAEYVQVANAK